MLTKKSRYYGLEEIDTLVENGELVTGLTLRSNEIAEKALSHQIESGNRLDHLAYQYYRDTFHWWRICDANPQFLSPLSVVNQDPVVDYSVEINWSTELPAWYLLKREMSQITGVLKVLLGSEEAGNPTRYLRRYEDSNNADDYELGVLSEDYAQSLSNAVLTQELGEVIFNGLLGLGVDLSTGAQIDAVDSTTWQIEALDTGVVYLLYLENNEIPVIRLVQEHHWVIRLEINRFSDSLARVQQKLTELGIEMLGEMTLLDKLGQSINIPVPKR